MESVVLENLSAEQKLIVDILINEGKLQALEELLDFFNKEYYVSAKEDPYYAYYVKYVIEIIQKRISMLGDDNE